MRAVMMTSWALFLGMFLLQVGNGIQATLLGLRGSIEGFSAFQMSFVMAGYFLGFLGGSRITPWLIRRVGHVRVFAALASFVSAIMILYPVLPDPVAWSLLRIAIGFCFSGVYVTAESWLNNSATNETRGATLGIYIVVQMAGITLAQYLLNLGDAGGFVLFIVPSVLVSISFAPILLSISPTPPFQSTKPMSLLELYRTSPLGCVGMFFSGGISAAIFGMSSVYATEAGFSVVQVTAFVSSFFMGGLFLQFPIGWLSDHMDRRVLIFIAAAVGAIAGFIAVVLSGAFVPLLVLGFIIGGLVLIGDVKTTWSFSAFTVLIYYSLTNLSSLRLSKDERLYPTIISWAGLASCLFLPFWVDPKIWIVGIVLILVGLFWQKLFNRTK